MLVRGLQFVTKFRRHNFMRSQMTMTNLPVAPYFFYYYYYAFPGGGEK